MCDVCDKSDMIGVCSSGLGPMSLAYCSECLKKHAEPEFMFELTYESCGEEVAEWVHKMHTWRDGKYVSWLEWVQEQRGKSNESVS